MPSEVGSGQVSILPTFKGFRKAVDSEVDASAKSADRGFRQALSKTGGESGKETGRGFKRAFESQSTGFSSKATRELEQSVATAARALSASRLKEQDAAGKVRLAEAQLAEARQKYAADSSQVIRAEERLATANRQVEAAQERTESSTQTLRAAQQRLADSADESGNRFVGAWRNANNRVADVFRGSFLGTAAANIVTGFVSNIGRAIREGVRNAIDFTRGTIDMASEFEQSIGAVDAVFKDSAGQMHEWARTAAETVGLSKNSYSQLSTVIAAQLKNLGVPMDEIAGKTNELVSLGADLSAQFGGSTSEAVSALSSLLRGERDPIERYGVSLKQADIDARKAAMGLDELTGEADKQATIQATLGLLYEQTADAQGTFARESDTLAGKQQRLNAQWEDARTTLGEAFMPIAQKVTDVLSRDLMPAISELVEKHGPGLAAAFEAAIPSFQQLADEILPKLPEILESIADTLPSILETASTLGPGLIDLMGKFANGAVQIQQFFESTGEKFENGAAQWGGFFGMVGDWWNSTIAAFSNGASQIGAFFGAIGASFANGWAQISGFFTRLGAAFANGASQIAQFASAVGARVGEVLGFIGSIPGRVGEIFTGVGSWLVDSGRALIEGFIDGIKAMVGKVGDAVGSVVDWARGFFPNSPAKRGPLSGSGWTKLGQSGSAFMEQWTSGFGRPDLTGALSAAAATAQAPTALAEVRSGVSAGASRDGDRWEMVLDDGTVLGGYVRRKSASVTSDFASTFRGGRRS